MQTIACGSFTFASPFTAGRSRNFGFTAPPVNHSDPTFKFFAINNPEGLHASELFLDVKSDETGGLVHEARLFPASGVVTGVIVDVTTLGAYTTVWLKVEKIGRDTDEAVPPYYP